MGVELGPERNLRSIRTWVWISEYGHTPRHLQCLFVQTDPDTGRHRQAQTVTNTGSDTDRSGHKQTDTDRYRQTEIDTDRHIQKLISATFGECITLNANWHRGRPEAT